MPEPALTKDSLNSCAERDAEQGRQRRGRGAGGVRVGLGAEPPRGLSAVVRAVEVGGSGRGRWGGPARSVTHAGREGGFEEVTRGGSVLLPQSSGATKVMSTPRGVGTAAGGLSHPRLGFRRSLSLLPATSKVQGWRGQFPGRPQGMKGGLLGGSGGWDPQTAGGLAPAGWPGPGLSPQAWEQP